MGINIICMAKFCSNSGQEYDINSIAEIEEYLRDQIRGFDYLDIVGNHVLIYHRNDPLGIQIGKAFGIPEGRKQLK